MWLCYYILIVLKRGVCNICYIEMMKIMKIFNMIYLFLNYKFCLFNFFIFLGIVNKDKEKKELFFFISFELYLLKFLLVIKDD